MKEEDLKAVAFYRKHDFGGEPEYYNIGDDVTFWQGDDFNDKYLSLIVIKPAKVHCYQHSTGKGVHKVYAKGDYPSLDELEGLSKFLVIPDNAYWAIALRLIDETKSPVGRYQLTFVAHGLGKTAIESSHKDDSAKYAQLESTTSDNEITCALYVRDMQTGAYVITGSIHLHFDSTHGVISVDDINVAEESTFHLEPHLVDNTKFDLIMSEKHAS
ncbi:beta/gamma crystallin domain-containing protein [Halomonas stenophila]|uniref:Uncharacterized protein n=1 Tax=Halomonas stenophila TaxID=795312 RepID=A0A7W5EV24_9GAMM|nr:beta/gamma crystallin domain-containing protein [Halomonas stenophila]MBB3231330.1 hypothetical protein [Halomonas stenophila]